MIVNIQMDTNTPEDRATLVMLLQANNAVRQNMSTDTPAEPIGNPPAEGETPATKTGLKAVPDSDELPDDVAYAGVMNNYPPCSENTEEGPEVDADGVEWSKELHASTKTKTQDGCWKKRRGNLKTPESKPVEKQDALEPTLANFTAVVKKHVGKFGLDRTKKALMEAVGSDHPGEMPQSKYVAAMAALTADKGDSVSDSDLSDFV